MFSTLSDAANDLEDQQYFSLFRNNQDIEADDKDDAKSTVLKWLGINFP